MWVTRAVTGKTGPTQESGGGIANYGVLRITWGAALPPETAGGPSHSCYLAALAADPRVADAEHAQGPHWRSYRVSEGASRQAGPLIEL